MTRRGVARAPDANRAASLIHFPDVDEDQLVEPMPTPAALFIQLIQLRCSFDAPSRSSHGLAEASLRCDGHVQKDHRCDKPRRRYNAGWNRSGPQWSLSPRWASPWPRV